jgi:hypothetical protein
VYVRVVRFTGVAAEHMDAQLERIRGAGGPPEGVPSMTLKILHDREQGTAVVLQHFASAEDMEQGARVFAAMDASDTPGTRASVDSCEVLLEIGS